MTDRFRSVALALRDHVSGTYELLAAADAVVALDADVFPVVKSPDGNATYNFETRRWDFNSEYLIGKARDNDGVMMYMTEAAPRKVLAIQELRRVVPGVPLIQYKKAVEAALYRHQQDNSPECSE